MPQIDLDQEIAEIRSARAETKAAIRAMQDELLRLEGAQRILEKIAEKAMAPPPSAPKQGVAGSRLPIDPTEDDDEDGVSGPREVDLAVAGSNGNGR